MLETFGQDGMSSDESDHDGAIETTYCPKRMPWRRDIDGELKLIDDKYRRLARTQVRRGAKPAIRVRPSGIISTRDPVTRLPISFYNASWLVGKTDTYVRRTLKATNDAFSWRELTIQ
jgi:hypothetical protein